MYPSASGSVFIERLDVSPSISPSLPVTFCVMCCSCCSKSSCFPSFFFFSLSFQWSIGVLSCLYIFSLPLFFHSFSVLPLVSSCLQRLYFIPLRGFFPSFLFRPLFLFPTCSSLFGECFGLFSLSLTLFHSHCMTSSNVHLSEHICVFLFTFVHVSDSVTSSLSTFTALTWTVTVTDREEREREWTGENNWKILLLLVSWFYWLLLSSCFSLTFCGSCFLFLL